MSKLNKVCVNIDQTDPAKGGFTDTEKAQARANIGAGTGVGNSDITRYDLSGNDHPVEELNIYQKSIGNAEFKDGATNLGSTVPTPSMATDEGKVPVAYYRDGRGYFLLEKYKDDRLPDSDSSNVGQVLTVDSHGVASWELPESEIPATGTNYQVLTIYNDEPQWQWAYQPLAGYNVTQRVNQAQTWRPYFDCNYAVKFNYNSYPTMYSDTNSHETEFNMANGQLRCKITYASKATVTDYNSIRFQFKTNSGRDLVITGTYHDHMANTTPDSVNVCGYTASTDTYVGLYCKPVNDYIGFTQFAESTDFCETIELNISWVNTKNFRMEDRVVIKRMHDYTNAFGDGLTLYEYYGTLTNSSV